MANDLIQQSNRNPMKPHQLQRRALAVFLSISLAVVAHAGTFKRISIDGTFGDWAGVPVAYNDASETTAGADFRQVYVANDDQYLYIRFTLYAPDSPFTSRNNIFIDSDDNAGTGFHPVPSSTCFRRCGVTRVPPLASVAM